MPAVRLRRPILPDERRPLEEPMRALLVDTAGPVVGIAAFVDGELTYAADARVAAGTEAWLATHVGHALGTLGGLDRVGVTVGPGAFTGLRVGVASALGLAVARGVPVAPLSSLALRAALVQGEPRVLALLDARKGRLYAGWFDTRGPVPLAVGEEGDLSPEAAVAGEPGVAVGEGALVVPDALARAGHRAAPEPARSPVRAGGALLGASSTVPAENIGLKYIRDPDAQRPGG